MKLDTEIQIGKKKAVYPSKTTINLYYKEDKSTKISTIVIDVIFGVVLLLGVAKFAFLDPIMEKNDAYDAWQKNQNHLEQQMSAIKDYDEVRSEYSRYSYSTLAAGENLWDRLEVLAMLEEVVFPNGSVKSLNIVDNAVSITFEGSDIDTTAHIISTLESYSMVDSVAVAGQSGNVAESSHTTSLIITLTDLTADESGEAGGEQ